MESPAKAPPPPPDVSTGYTLLFIATICYACGFGLISLAESSVLSIVLGTILLSAAGSCVFTAFDTCFVSGPDRLGPVFARAAAASAAVARKTSLKIVKASWTGDHVAYQILVHMGAKQSNVHRRYRDFASLVADSPTAASHRALLPPKLWIFESGADALRHPQLLERRAALDALLQALAADLNAKSVVDVVRIFHLPH